MFGGGDKSGFRDSPVKVIAEVPLEDFSLGVSQKTGYSELLDFRTDKIRDKYIARNLLLILTGVFLLVQTVVVFTLVSVIIFKQSEMAAKLQPLMATVVAGTLAQTYGILKIMVKYYFSE